MKIMNVEMDKVLWMYAVFAACMVGIYTPVLGVSMFSFFAWAIVFLVVGHMKAGAKDGSVEEHHLIWLKRTFWLFNFWFLLGTIIFIAAFVKYGDYSAFEQLGAEGVTPEDMDQMFMESNKAFTWSALPASALLIEWYLWRLWQGASAYKEGAEVNNVKRWI